MATKASTRAKHKTKSSRSKAATRRKSGARSAKPRVQHAPRGRSAAAQRKGRTRNRTRIPAALARMAKKVGGISAAQIVPGHATDLLEQDHREVEAYFEQFEQLDSNAQKQKLAAKICLALTVHAQLEEELVYPLARQEMDEADLVDEAEVEHAAAKQLIAEIEGMSPRDKLFDAKVKVLGEYVKHHVDEEENELFPKMKKADLDFYKLGAKLAARKTALLMEARA